jgi:hypothetical protein
MLPTKEQQQNRRFLIRNYAEESMMYQYVYNSHPRVLYPAKVSFKKGRENKVFFRCTKADRAYH